jgi:type II secretory pathway pseudopilin PulG
MNFFQKINKKGSGLIEVVIATSIFSVVSVVFLNSFITISDVHKRNTFSIKGQLLAEEGIEAVRYIGDSNWSEIGALSNGVDYYFELHTSNWTTTTTPEVIDGFFYRVFRLSAVNRQNGVIVDAGGTTDVNTRKANVTVSWRWKNATTTVQYETYVINI